MIILLASRKEESKTGGKKVTEKERLNSRVHRRVWERGRGDSFGGEGENTFYENDEMLQWRLRVSLRF